MINNPCYLFRKLKNILDEKKINYDYFETIYNKASILSA